jgi:hypothetical protein
MDKRIQDFRNFLYLAWQHLGLPEPTAIQYDIADYLQHGPKRQCIQAFRGVGKSWITSAFVCHQLLLDPQKNVLVVSASKTRADDFSTFTLRLINDMEMLQHLRPKDSQRNSKISFDVGPAEPDHAPSVKSVGVLGQMTGSRADIIVADDVESLNNSATQTMRDKLSEVIKEFDAILKPQGRVTFLGTPQTEQSIYAVLPERGYENRIWTARFPSKKQVTKYGTDLAPSISNALDEDSELVNTPVDPKRFDAIDLAEREASYGRSGFLLQFMLDTSLSDQDRYPLKLTDLIVMNLNPDNGPEKVIWAASPELVERDLECVGFNGDRYYRPMAIQGDWIPYQGSVMAIDPSGRGADETSYAVVKNINSQLFVLEAGGLRSGYDESTLKKLVEIAKRQKVNQVIIEENFGGGMFTQLITPFFRNEYPVGIEEVRHNIQKERRICDTIEPVTSSHRLIIDRKVIQKDFKTPDVHYQLFHQMSRITRDRGALRHDDRLDVLSMAVRYWSDQMAADRDEALATRKAELMDMEIERFTAHVVGRRPEPLNWIS